MNIAFLDTVGLLYNGDTLKERGLGGSEQAVILLSKELVELGFNVTVFNACDKSGNYSGVTYCDLSDPKLQTEEFDILISSRSVAPFAEDKHFDFFKEHYNIDPSPFTNIAKNSKYKVLWMHDTFCDGDGFIQEYLLKGYIDKLFTLSDWHASYVSTAFHDNVDRYPEFFKPFIFNTRNGVVNYKSEIDLSKKDKNHFIYNSSITKGMMPLLEQVWPFVKAIIPEAHLTIVGGYYENNEDEIDKFKSDFNEVYDKYHGKEGVSFTGIVTPSEIADLLETTTFMLYPNIYPETFGISPLEAVNSNVCLIGYNFGALEEVVPDDTAYKEPFFYGMLEESHPRLLNLIAEAYHDDYYRQQKQYACNKYKEFLGWDVVALQWKHFFYRTLGAYLPIEETHRHRYNIGNIQKLWKKVNTNPEEFIEDYSMEDEQEIIIISPFYNAEEYVVQHIVSTATQNYRNFKHYLINDVSDDNSSGMVKAILDELPEHIRKRYILIENETKEYALGNQIKVIKEQSEDAIIVLLDGDDFLVNDPDILKYINRLHHQGHKFTYGSCKSLADDLNLVAQPYPRVVIELRDYRNHKFNWNMPYTHLRTFRKEVFDRVDESCFYDENGEVYKFGADAAMFYDLIETCSYDEIKCVQRILVNYNDLNPLNDYKVNADEQNVTAEKIMNKE